MNKVVLVGMILLAGCDASGEHRAINKTDSTVYSPERGYYIQEFRLTDGTRCVIVANHGIACEWRK